MLIYGLELENKLKKNEDIIESNFWNKAKVSHKISEYVNKNCRLKK